jgi:hypothetical protein
VIKSERIVEFGWSLHSKVISYFPGWQYHFYVMHGILDIKESEQVSGCCKIINVSFLCNKYLIK